MIFLNEAMFFSVFLFTTGANEHWNPNNNALPIQMPTHKKQKHGLLEYFYFTDVKLQKMASACLVNCIVLSEV